MAEEQLRREISLLRDEVEGIANLRRADLEHAHQERIDTRKLPPMAQMTRLQKRYFLEPWMTAGTIVAGVLAFASFFLSLFTPLHSEFGWLGILFVVIGGGFLLTKLMFMQWNSKTEGDLRSKSSSPHGY